MTAAGVGGAEASRPVAKTRDASVKPPINGTGTDATKGRSQVGAHGQNTGAGGQGPGATGLHPPILGAPGNQGKALGADVGKSVRGGPK